MPYRIVPLITGEIYHIFNRGVEKRDIFTEKREYKRFLETAFYYQRADIKIRFSQAQAEIDEIDSQNEKLIEIFVYCLMPNHFHFLLRQLQDGGTSTFIRKLLNSYTRYFNIKHKRIGPLFQGQFKAIRIETDEQLVHVSRYIHLNPIVDYLVKDLRQYEWSSYPEYTGLSKNSFCDKEEILSFFKSTKNYESFVLDHMDYAKRLEEIKHLTLEY